MRKIKSEQDVNEMVNASTKSFEDEWLTNERQKMTKSQLKYRKEPQEC